MPQKSPTLYHAMEGRGRNLAIGKDPYLTLENIPRSSRTSILLRGHVVIQDDVDETFFPTLDMRGFTTVYFNIDRELIDHPDDGEQTQLKFEALLAADDSSYTAGRIGIQWPKAVVTRGARYIISEVMEQTQAAASGGSSAQAGATVLKVSSKFTVH